MDHVSHYLHSGAEIEYDRYISTEVLNGREGNVIEFN